MRLKDRTARFMGFVLPCALILAATPVNAELYQFSYTFSEGSVQPYAPGSRLTGFLEGTPDPDNADRVLITGFGAVSQIIPDYGTFDFPSIEANEFNTYKADGRDPVVTFSGTEIAFRACPSGFTADGDFGDGTLNDCPFAADGGFLIETAAFGVGYATAAIGGGADSPCTVDAGVRNTYGCRLSEFGTNPASWQLSLVTVDPSVDLDPTVTLGDNTSLDKDVAVEENVVVGDNVTLDKGSSVGADSEIGADTSLDAGTSIGADVTIGSNVTIDADVTIQDGVTIEDNVHIGRGALICSGVTIGDSADIGKNALVASDVPATSAIPGARDEPGECP